MDINAYDRFSIFNLMDMADHFTPINERYKWLFTEVATPREMWAYYTHNHMFIKHYAMDNDNGYERGTIVPEPAMRICICVQLMYYAITPKKIDEFYAIS